MDLKELLRLAREEKTKSEQEWISGLKLIESLKNKVGVLEIDL